MKPKFDLNSPLFLLVKDFLNKESIKALETDQTVEKSVLPIYALPKTKGHLKKKTKYEQIASGVLVNVKNEYFVFTADHVFKDTKEYAIAISTGNGNLIQQFKGERYTSNNATKNDKDIYDASVYHIRAKLPKSLKDIAITLDKIDFKNDDNDQPIFLISGFRVRDSSTEGNSVNSKRKSFPTIEMNTKDYENFNFHKKSHILLAYDDQILIDGNWKMSPKPKGMSGGAIIKVKGTKTSELNNNKNLKQILTAITIEQHRGKHKNPGVLVGTRINVYLGLIYQFVPGLLDDFLKNYSEENKLCPNTVIANSGQSCKK